MRSMEASGDEKSRLLGSDHRDPQILPADYIIALPWFDPGTPEYDETMDGDSLVEDVVVAKKKGPELLKNFYKVCKGNRKVAKGAIARAFAEDLFEWLPAQGFSVRPFLSADETEIYLRISIDDVSLEKFYAEKLGLQLQVTWDMVKALDISQPEKDSSPPYVTYDADLIEQNLQYLHEDKMFKKYFMKYPKKGSIFRTIERVRILEVLFVSLFNREELQVRGIILDNFPVHYKGALEMLAKEWATISCRSFFDFTANQPIHYIRNYFGENIAFYFLWVAFTIRMLTGIAVLGVLVKIYSLVKSSDEDEEIWVFSWVGIVVGWGALYTILWRRTQHFYCAEWNCHNSKPLTRPGFRGTLEPNPLNYNESSRQYPEMWSRIWKIFSTVVTCFFIGLVFNCVGAIFFMRPVLVEHFGKMGVTIASVCISVQIAIFNLVWDPISKALTRLENHRTQQEHNHSLTVKTYCFQFVNTYNSFIYIGFAQKYRGIGCHDNDCLPELQVALITTYGSMVAMAVLGAALPYLQMWWGLRQEEKSALEKYNKRVQSGAIAATEAPKRSFMEKQASMLPYGDDEILADYLSLVLPLGYVFLFGAVSPSLPLLTLFQFLLRFRVDAWKLCNVFQKAYPRAVMGIGAWTGINETVAWLGILTSVAIPVVNLRIFDHYSLLVKLSIAFGIEHALVLIKVVCGGFVPEVSAAEDLMMRRRAFVTERMMLGKQINANVNSVLEAPLERPKAGSIPRLDQTSSEWPHIDTEDGQVHSRAEDPERY